MDSPSPHGKERVPSQGSDKEKKGEGNQEEKGPEPPQTRHQEVPEPGSQPPSGGRGREENVEARGEYEEEASEENRQPEAPILRQPAPQMEAPNGQKGRDEEGCEAKGKVEDRLDRRPNGPHDVP